MFFNDYVKEKIRESFIKKVIVNEITGSSWRFKRFGRLPYILHKLKILYQNRKMEYIDFEVEISDNNSDEYFLKN